MVIFPFIHFLFIEILFIISFSLKSHGSIRDNYPGTSYVSGCFRIPTVLRRQEKGTHICMKYDWPLHHNARAELETFELLRLLEVTNLTYY
jgi:hypothetical protein